MYQSYIIIFIIIALILGFFYARENLTMTPFSRPIAGNNVCGILCGCLESEIQPLGSWPAVCKPVQKDRTIEYGWAGAPVVMPAMGLNPTATW